MTVNLMFSRVAFRGSAVLAVLAGLSGCAGDPDPVYAQALGIQCTRVGGALANFACNNRPPGQGQEQVSRYCYATIGSANCFDRPDPDRKNQVLGSSGY
ncbi:MAG: hypothetical protein EXQ84_00460 [Rhodospirillaceae bacterium]|nr:hypothetical protein [Rhodospirillaceae bacterium]